MSMPVNTTPIVLAAMERCVAAGGYRSCSEKCSGTGVVNSTTPSSSVAVTFLPAPGQPRPYGGSGLFAPFQGRSGRLCGRGLAERVLWSEFLGLGVEHEQLIPLRFPGTLRRGIARNASSNVL